MKRTSWPCSLREATQRRRYLSRAHAGAAQLGGNVCQLPQQVINLAPVDGPRRVPRDHGRPAAAFQFEPALVGEQPIGEGHRVEVHPEIKRPAGESAAAGRRA